MIAKTKDKLMMFEDEISSFVNQLESIYLVTTGPSVERRRAERVGVMIPIEIRPLDENMKPADYVMHGVTRDVSTGGVGFISSDPDRASASFNHVYAIQVGSM